jgi:collagenase-like PrtC family protease
MKFAIGYQQPKNGERFSKIITDYRKHIAEVYFPWTGCPSGRAALGGARGHTDWNAQYILEDDLVKIRKMGVKLDLLFNANCYGGRAVSQYLENEVVSIMSHLADFCGGADIVTTTSLAVARTVKRNFPQTEVRASVNMRIGTPQAMSYVAGLFDSFYICRDIQRNIQEVKKVKEWCDINGKGLFMLANSGCLRCCPGQTFHDNTVAHDGEIDEIKNIKNWTPHVCWNLYKKSDNFAEILKATWLRPDDIHHYNSIFPTVKLATRQHNHPRMVIDAYVNRCFKGDLLNLLEPGFSSIFMPYFIDNSAFPDDWFNKTSNCGNQCHNCGYCNQIIKQVLKKYENI